MISKFGYRSEATAEQVTYGRKWCASRHGTRLTSIDVTYAEVSGVGNDVGTSARISPVLEIVCAFGGNQEQDNSAHYMGLVYISKPDEVPSS